MTVLMGRNRNEIETKANETEPATPLETIKRPVTAGNSTGTVSLSTIRSGGYGIRELLSSYICATHPKFGRALSLSPRLCIFR